jgi:hypothetical protein
MLLMTGTRILNHSIVYWPNIGTRSSTRRRISCESDFSPNRLTDASPDLERRCSGGSIDLQNSLIITIEATDLSVVMVVVKFGVIQSVRVASSINILANPAIISSRRANSTAPGSVSKSMEEVNVKIMRHDRPGMEPRWR